MEYTAVESPQKFLEEILQKYQEGLVKPLKFFPQTSYKFAQLLKDKKNSPEDAVDKVKADFFGNDFSMGEFEDPYYRICFENSSPLDEEFQANALLLFNPLLDHMKDHKGR